MLKNVLYFYNINEIGGVESFFYYLAKTYINYDLTVYYKYGNEAQIERLRKYCRVRQYNGEKIVCEKAFLNYAVDIIDNIEAKEYIQIIHNNYRLSKQNPRFSSKITKFVGVSQYVCDEFKAYTGKDCEFVGIPINIDKPKKPLILISATRLTEEKGKDRMKLLGEELNKSGIPYIWYVFTNSTDAINNPNIIYMKPRLNIMDFISISDYLVQLSDHERILPKCS